MIADRLGTKKSLLLSFFMGGLFGTLLIIDTKLNIIILLACVLLSKFGVSSAFNLCFLVTAEYFPVNYASSVFGACNIAARLTSIFAPMVSEIKHPIPMIIYAILCFSSIIGTNLI